VSLSQAGPLPNPAPVERRAHDRAGVGVHEEDGWIRFNPGDDAICPGMKQLEAQARGDVILPARAFPCEKLVLTSIRYAIVRVRLCRSGGGDPRPGVSRFEFPPCDRCHSKLEIEVISLAMEAEMIPAAAVG